MRRSIVWTATGLAFVALCSGARQARADSLIETYQDPGVQDITTGTNPAVCQNTTTPGGGAGCVFGEETFTNATTGGFSDTLANGAIGVTYSGNYNINAADQYGGAGGTGNYIVTTSNPGYTANLTYNSADMPGINYFGMWLSALDLGNYISFYDGSTLVGTYSPQDLINAVGSCAGTNPYCHNPAGIGNNNQQYVFINFFDQGGYFTSVHFDEYNGLGGYESDNQTFGYLNPITPFGTPIPEPASVAVLGAGLLALAAARRAKRAT